MKKKLRKGRLHMYDIMEENMAGKYEVIRNERGSAKHEDRLYYRTYIPASLTSIRPI